MTTNSRALIRTSALFSPANQSSSTYSRLLNACKHLRPLLQIHSRVIVSGLREDSSTLTHLINAYSSSGKCDSSRSVFDSASSPCVLLWNTVIRAYVTAKRYTEALRMYASMAEQEEEGLRPDKYTFNFVVKACTGALDLRAGIMVHREIARRKLECDVFIGTSLVDMYCKMGDPRLARQVFDKLLSKDIVACNAMIAGLSQGSDPTEAFGFFRAVQAWGLGINSVSLLNLVPAVSRSGDLGSCRAVHGYAVRRDFGTAVLNGIIDMYSKCEEVGVARRVFDSMKCRDDISWGTMMSGYAFNGRFLEVLELFNRTRGTNLKRNEVSLISALLGASELRDLEKGKEIHDFARRDGLDSHIRVATAIMTMYAKCGETNRATDLFHKLQRKDSIARSSLLSAFVQSGYPEEALSVFRDTQDNELFPDGTALSSVLSACADLSQINLGKSVHCYAIKASIDSDTLSGTSILSLYAKCGLFSHARTMLNQLPSKDVVTWNSLINAYAQIGEPYRAMEAFDELRSSDTKPDAITMVGVIQACSLLNDLHRGASVHGQVVKSGLERESRVTNSLVGMYARRGIVSSADLLFDGTPRSSKNEVSWNIIISGYAQSGRSDEAISAFHRMRSENFKPNPVTLASVIPAVAHLSALAGGAALHAYAIKTGFSSATPVGNCLVDMYGKCGRIDFAEKCFDEMEYKDTVSWNAMLSGYSVHGQGERAVSLFSLMRGSRVRPDGVSFVSVLSACR